MKLKLSILILLLCTAFATKANWNWHKRTNLLNCKRDQAVGFSIGIQGYVCCGMDTNNITLNDLWCYNSFTNTWSQKANLPGAPRRCPFGFAINGLGYVGGGIADSSTYGTRFTDLYAYDPNTNAWTTKAAYTTTGNGVYRCASTSCNGKGYVIGGRNSFSSTNTVYEYNPLTDTWLMRAMFPGVPTSSGGRDGGVAFSMNLKVYFGTGRDDSFYQNDFWEYDPATDIWTRKADLPGVGRQSAVGFVVQNKGFIATGSNGGFLKDCWWYDVTTNQWNFANNFDGSGRKSAVAFSILDSGYIATGKAASGTKQDLYVTADEPIAPSLIEEIDNFTFSVSPNPCINQPLTIHFNSALNAAKIELYNLQGQLVYTDQCHGNNYDLPAPPQKGNYWLVVSNQTFKTVTKQVTFN